MKKYNIALGFYQELSTAQDVISKLKQNRFTRFAVLSHKPGQPLEIQRHFSLFHPWMIDAEIVNHYKKYLFIDEILILVQVEQSEVREALAILRQVKSGHPVTFLLRSPLEEEREVEIHTEPATPEQLGEGAVALALSLQRISLDEGHNQLLMERFKTSSRLLNYLHQDIADAEYIEQTVPSSAEWLLDNMYVLESSIDDVKRNLPNEYYKVLPKLVTGPLKEYPRIYALAVEMVKLSAGMLNRENITHFLHSYQKQVPLTIGELWAFPLLLRFRLIEWVEFLAINVDNRMREGELASFWGNRLLSAARHEPEKLPLLLDELSGKSTTLSSHFVEELLDHLFDEEQLLLLIKKWAEERYSQPLADILHQEHLDETSEQVLFSNCIRSLITLSQLAWPHIFEAVSPVDALLKQDPVEAYANMDFETRNRYRDVVEEIARRVRRPETEVAKTALLLAQSGVEPYAQHIGYYLIDAGRQQLEKSVHYTPTHVQRAQRWTYRYAPYIYLGGITGLIALAELLLFFFGMRSSHGVIDGIMLLLALLPLSELSVQGMNFFLTAFLPTPLLPKMSYESGIPDEYKTLVVVPMLLQNAESIKEQIESLEIRYLANTDPALYFSLFSDFTDAPEQHLKDDQELLQIVMEGMRTLEQKYGPGKFFLFHRQRCWCAGENAWIGWERKRGKLDVLNQFLMGSPMGENIVYVGQAELLKGIRYVITLDADTQLPKDQARALIETLAHPLNGPYLDAARKQLMRGYTIIQPRVGTDFAFSKCSWFCRIFSEPTVVDPYTQAISNVYQDLAGEGSYHGKGIYDLHTFHAVLSGRFPEEHLLSHDLIEGAFVRTGFASHICLFDTHPTDYLTWIKRQHRWMRGDWQIIDWLTAKVPLGKAQRESNPLSWINRWKIFDNLRRSLVPVALLLLLACAWTLSSEPIMWTVLALVVITLPFIFLCASKLFTHSFATLKSSFKELAILIARSLITIALLPFEAFLALDALLRVAYRRLVSHKHLLQWSAYEYMNNGLGHGHRRFLLQLGLVSFFAVAIFSAVIALDPFAKWTALPFCLLWLAAPLIVYLIDRPLNLPEAEKLPADDKRMLRKIARLTWRYFDELVGPQTNWLPPDNYQTALNIEIAQRTSPTNIGLGLLATMGAYDFSYITCDQCIDRALAAIQHIKKLERHKGHFLNWYHLQSLEPLSPRYVSTVDSGNFLACLWTLKQGIEELLASPIIPPEAWSGILDTQELLQEDAKLETPLLLAEEPSFFTAVKKGVQKMAECAEKYEQIYWCRQLSEQLAAWDTVIARYFGWVELLDALSPEKLQLISPEALLWQQQAASWSPSLLRLAEKTTPPALDQLCKEALRSDLLKEVQAWGRKLQEALSTAQWLAGEKVALALQITKEIEQISQEMNLKFLYNSHRKLFAIGYNIDNRRLDSSYYDLLASEARVASFVAIAKQDVPLEHWWALGRPYNNVMGRKVLLSWGGTMFEYLMPALFNKQYPDSLLGNACDAAVACQINYGKQRGIPWGISEAAFSAIDAHKIYQYRSFGVPGLGLKRGLEQDLVISPYSTALALAVQPQAALSNLRKLAEKQQANMLGEYGYYESIDYSRQRSPTGERGVIVHTYMSHHQGMILAAINNLLNSDLLIRRFNKDPRVRGIQSLMYERIPFAPPVKIGISRKEPATRRLEPFSQTPLLGVIPTPESVTPKINLLSNEKYSLMISNTGGGYSRWDTIELYRWRADTTRDAWGSFCYIKDLRSGEIWSTTYQPTQTAGREYNVNFKGDRAEFTRRDHLIETHMEVVVTPEDNAEIRMITLTNHSNEERYLELTSYLELSLAPHQTDRFHPCFNKLFIETEAVPEHAALLGFRRLRAPHEQPLWAVHLLTSNVKLADPIQYETDRVKFIGRGNSLQRPAALNGDLSNTTGTVLDPIFSLRGRILIQPGRRVRVSLITGIAESRNAAIALAEKYKEITASYRGIELAWTYSQLELRYLRIHQEEVQLFQKLASRLIYPHTQLRGIEERIRKNRLGQSSLWSLGISGDQPIVVATVGDIYDVDLVKQLLVAHAFWSLRGLKVDLVILNEEEAGYLQPLNDYLRSLVQAHAFRGQVDVPGGVFLRSTVNIPDDQQNLLLAVASAVMIASRGALRQQLVSPRRPLPRSPKLSISGQVAEEPSRPLPFLELPYFNGLGGFTPDGRGYVIYLGPNTYTPAPWINVLANPQFGTLVSEAGSGCTWYGNSQSNRLTPWSNDPLLDPICDAIYIRDEELGTYWTPTPAPIRELDAYRVTHGQGYSRFEHNSHGIEQQLLLFVPMDDQGGLPLRIQQLHLYNNSARKRRLSVTAYAEWVLGGDKEETQMHIVTEWDSESQALFAYNCYHPDFGSSVAFVYASLPLHSYSGDRTEFIGRNRSAAAPEAMGREALSGRIGAALDSCAALQLKIELGPKQETNVVFVLGYAPDVETARQLIAESRQAEKIDQLLATTQAWWERTLGTIQVELPDQATNFLFNRWLLYQDLSCRFWGRAGFYQSSGAYGFRDQLQDTMALVYSLPGVARDYILKAAARQYVEGDVQHWWHPQSGAGVRTRCSDDLLWLPFVTAHYVRVTGDRAILDENIPFLAGEKLGEGQEELFQVPTVSEETGTLLEHCRRALKKGMSAGPHGLPLIGSGDWNDGMNRVGIQGKGESVWLAWFLIHVLNDMGELLRLHAGQQEAGEGFRIEAKRLAETIEATAWDGAWYRRAYFDDGTPIGSKANAEASIDSLAQSWAVISGAANPQRAALALKSAEEYLVKGAEKMVLLLTPPFDKTPLDPGYIKGYPPGVRENGGQYTHGSTWLALAYARLGEGNKAVDLLRMLAPTVHTPTVEETNLYKVEPYAIAADIYDLPGQIGRGGWTWYTGSAGWLYRVWLEEVLGFSLRGQTLQIKGSIPKEWKGYKIHYRYKSAQYEIRVSNPKQISRGSPSVKLDGVSLASAEIPLVDDGKSHLVEIELREM